MHLKNPIFGTTYSQTNNVIVRKLPAGETKVVTSATWPKIEGFHVEFRALENDQREKLLTFFRSIAGEEVTLTDSEGSNWRGFITTDPQIKRERDNCMYYTEFTFEGMKV